MRPVADAYQNRFLENWQEIATIRKPIIAAVSGFAVTTIYPFSPSPPFLRAALTRHAMFFFLLFLPSSGAAASSR
jgi:hypothetical protein